MKQRLLALGLLLAVGFSSCNNDEELVKANTDYAEPGTAVIGASFYSVKSAATKAVGDPLAAFDAEKEIKSIAFFVQVGADDNLQIFESTKAAGTTGGLLDQLKETTLGTKGEYTAKFKMKLSGTANINMFALANYAENGLNPNSFNSVTALKEAVSTALADAANPERPFLMMGTHTVTAMEEGEVYEAAFKMDRLVARVDVVNEAYNANAAKGFRLTSIQLLNAKSASSLLPNQASVSNPIAVVAAKDPKTHVVGYDAAGVVSTTEAVIVKQRIDTVYMYENTNVAPASAPTAIQLSGTFNGTPVDQRVEFLREEADGTKTQLAIGRNNLYTVRILPAQDSTTISFDIQVEDWTYAKGDTITVTSKNEVPVLGNFAEADLAQATYNTTTKRIDITAANATELENLAGTVTFTAEGNQDTEIAFEYIGRKGATWMNNAVTKGDLQGYQPTKAGGLILKREYKIDLSEVVTELKANSTVPSDAFVLIQNSKNAKLSDTIRICFRPDYEGIDDAQPVLMKDGKFWAPINVGAKNTINKAATSGDITDACGKLFQWGRKFGFAATNNATTTAADTTGIGSKVQDSPNTPLGRPVQSDLTNMSKWDGKFIYSTDNLKYNWLQINGDGNANPDESGMVKDAWYQQLWNANEGKGNSEVVKTDADPCPKGWRVPTLAEWTAIGADGSTVYSMDGSSLIVPGKESDKKLVLPAAGIRSGGTGASSRQGSYGYYWSSVPSASALASNVYFNSAGKLSTGTNYRAGGSSVRCVQE